MLKRLNDALFKDLGWKIFALVSAVLIWFVAMSIEDPVSTTTRTLRITVNSEDYLGGLGLVNMTKLNSPTVTVEIKAKKSDLAKFDPNSTLVSAYVDFRQVTSSYINRVDETIYLDVYVNLPQQYELIRKSPEKIGINIDLLESKEMKIVPIVSTASTPAGYEATDPYCSPERVIVTGPKSLLETIREIRTETAYISGSEDLVVKKDLQIINMDGEDITADDKLTLSVKNADVTAPILPFITVPIELMEKGKPASGYYVQETKVTPPTASIVGEREVLDEIFQVLINVELPEGAFEDVEKEYDLNEYIPEGTSLKKGDPQTVTVAFTIMEEESRSFTVPTNMIEVFYRKDDASNTDGGFNPDVAFDPNFNADPDMDEEQDDGLVFVEDAVEFDHDTIEIFLKGSAEAIANVRVFNGDIRLMLDITGLRPGEHTADLIVEPPRGVSAPDSPVTVDFRVIGGEVEEVEETEIEGEQGEGAEGSQDLQDENM